MRTEGTPIDLCSVSLYSVVSVFWSVYCVFCVHMFCVSVFWSVYCVFCVHMFFVSVFLCSGLCIVCSVFICSVSLVSVFWSVYCVFCVHMCSLWSSLGDVKLGAGSKCCDARGSFRVIGRWCASECLLFPVGMLCACLDLPRKIWKQNVNLSDSGEDVVLERYNIFFFIWWFSSSSKVYQTTPPV